MFVLFIIGIFLVTYGTYNMLCYIFMLPTMAAGVATASIGKNNNSKYYDQAAIIIADRLVQRINLRPESLNIEGLTFLLSKGIALILGILLFMPMLFINRYLWGIVILVLILIQGVFVWKTIYSAKKELILNSKKTVKIFKNFLVISYVILNIVLILYMFT